MQLSPILPVLVNKFL